MPGTLQRVMHFITRDPKVRKVFYCCGFKYNCEVRKVNHAPHQYHGIYQIADLTADPPRVVFGDNFHHRTVKGKWKAGEHMGKGFVAMRAFTAQVELVHMLVQIARDPETRDVVFRENDHYLSGAMRVKGADKILSEALYVFVAQVQHNWNLKRLDPVNYALSTRDLTVSDSAPSEALDKEIAKGVVRLLMKVLQEQRFQNAVKALRTGQYPTGRNKNDAIRDFQAATEWNLPRLIEKYWTALKKGTNCQDGSKVEVLGFLVSSPTMAPGDYVWVEGGAQYNFGPASRMGMRFEHDDFAVIAAVNAKEVKIRHTKTGAERVEDATPRR